MAEEDGQEPKFFPGYLEDDHEVQEEKVKEYAFLEKAKDRRDSVGDLDVEVKGKLQESEGSSKWIPLLSQASRARVKAEEAVEEKELEEEEEAVTPEQKRLSRKLGSNPGVLRMSVSTRTGYFSSRRVRYMKPSLLGFDMRGRQLLFAESSHDLRRNPTKIPFGNIDVIELNNEGDFNGFYIHLVDATRIPNADAQGRLMFQTDTKEQAEKYVDKLQANIFLIATVYTVGGNGTWPEALLGVRNETGVCFSGGGTRAHVAACGQLRALREMGLLERERINYISSTSGGAWASSIFTYYERGARNDEDLLGSPTEPSELTMEKLYEKPCNIAAPSSSVMWQEMRRIFWSTPSPELWESVLGNIYLEKFGLNLDVPFGMRELLPTVRHYNRSLQKAKMNQTRPNRPFLVVHANMLGPEWADATDVVPIQFTGMYCGTPYMRKVHYNEKSKTNSVRKGLYTIGGGFIDTFAFGAQVNKNTFDNHKVLTRKWFLTEMFNKVRHNLKNLSNDARELLHKRKETGEMVKHFIRVPAPEKAFSLKHALGIASDGPALMYKNKMFRDQLNPRGHYFSPVANNKNRNKAKELDLVMEFSDGGVTDNLAIMCLLQRKVKRILAFHNSEIKLIDVKLEEVDHLRHSEIAKLWNTTNILPLFGVHFDPKTAQEKTTKYFANLGENQVFHTHRIKDLIKEAIKKRDAGEPMVFVQKYQVVSNDFWHIEGGWEVLVLWSFLDDCKMFTDQLPEEVQEEIQKDYRGEFGGYPNYKTFGQRKEFHIDPSLSVPQINLLAAHTEHCLKRNTGVVRAFVDGDIDVILPEEIKAKNRKLTALHEMEEAGIQPASSE